MNTYILTFRIADIGNRQDVYEIIHDIIELYSSNYSMDDTTSTIFYTSEKNDLIIEVIYSVLRKDDEIKCINLNKFQLIKISNGEKIISNEIDSLFV